MGRSFTYHCVGYGPETMNGEYTRRTVYTAMNRLDIEQETIRANRRGESIVLWTAQTKTGERIIGGQEVHADLIPHAGSIPCVCSSGCFICKGTGRTTRNWLKGFQVWQVERAKRGE